MGAVCVRDVREERALRQPTDISTRQVGEVRMNGNSASIMQALWVNGFSR
jgi:hypothetical protein